MPTGLYLTSKPTFATGSSWPTSAFGASGQAAATGHRSAFDRYWQHTCHADLLDGVPDPSSQLAWPAAIEGAVEIGLIVRSPSERCYRVRHGHQRLPVLRRHF